MLNIFPKLSEIPQELIVEKSIEQGSSLINGELVRLDTDSQDVCSPIAINHGGELKPVRLGSHPLMNHEIAGEILASSISAMRSEVWKSKSIDYRASCIEEFIHELAKYKDEIVRLLMWESCKPMAEAISEFDRTIEYTRLTIAAYREMYSGSETQYSNGFAGKIVNSPVGVVLAMGPSNYPLYETYSLALPALLTGNSVIMKVPRYGALLHSSIINLMQCAFPAGAINVIYGKNEETINPIMQTGNIDMLAYMGSNMFAEPIIQSHPRPYKLKKLLGLDAKNPAIVLHDADIEETAKELALGALAFNGQRCAAIKIIFAHSSIYNELMEVLRREIESEKICMPWDSDVRITPIFDRNRILYLKTLMEDALSKGAINYTNGGGTVLHTIFIPSLLGNITPNMRIYSEEQFGPIVPVVKYEDLDETIEYVSNSDFGQQISIFGKDEKVIADLARAYYLQCGRVNINTKCQRGPDIFPFTGKKFSGAGELSVTSTLREFTLRGVIAGKDNSITNGVLGMI